MRFVGFPVTRQFESHRPRWGALPLEPAQGQQGGQKQNENGYFFMVDDGQ